MSNEDELERRFRLAQVPIRINLTEFKKLTPSDRRELVFLLRTVNHHLDNESLDFLSGYLDE